MSKKIFVSVIFVSFSLLLSGCTKKFRSFFAQDVPWTPKHSYALSIDGSSDQVLSDKVPLVLNIKFDSDWNRDNKPPALDLWEDFSVNENIIDFLIKDIKIEGGEGSLYFRDEKDGKSSVGQPFDLGTKLRHGSTKLYYIPNQKESCHTHKIHIISTILTVDYSREVSKPVSFSLKLGEPSYNFKASTEDKISFISDEGTPIELTIDSSNSLASKQKYNLIKWCVTGGSGKLYIESAGVKKPICGNEPIEFGSSKLYYAPSKGSEGTHTIHLTVGNILGHIRKEASVSFEVHDHLVEDFKSSLVFESNEDLLPYKYAGCKLIITPLTEAGKSLSYHIKSVSMAGGKFMLENRELQEDIPLKVGENQLVFDPMGFTGDTFANIIVSNSKGDAHITTSNKQVLVSNPLFRSYGSIEEGRVKLHVYSAKKDLKDKCYLANYSINGGLRGTLKTLRGDTVEQGHPLNLGDNLFTIALDYASMARMNEAPKLYLTVVYPDHRREILEPIDLSMFLLETLSPKITDLEHESQELYKPLVENYTIPSAPSLESLKASEAIWNNSSSKIREVLAYLQTDTMVSPQAVAALTHLQRLSQETNDKKLKRVLTTNLLSNWYKEINEIHAAQSSKECEIRTDILEREVNSFSDVFESCRDIPGIEDIPGDLERIKLRIETLKRETIRKKTEEEKIKNEYKNFQQETRSAINTERKAREDAIESLAEEIKSIVHDIRTHSGDISDLQRKINELSRVTIELRSRIAQESQYIENAFHRIRSIEGTADRLSSAECLREADADHWS